MAFENSPMSKLDAVNICLSSMGEPTINSLDGVAVDAQMASDLIEETSMTVQSIGFHWNREKHTISPNISGNLLLPANTAKVDTVDGSKSTDVVQRGLRLYNVDENTYTFTSPLTVELYVILPFDELPLAAKQYITIRSARILQQRLLGNETLYKFNAQDEKSAYAVLIQDDMENADYNMLTDSWSVASILSRGYFARGNY
jgi:hypothetical protein